MLVTSCPECTTTFRISVGILEKAGGQVRCGRCAKIFDANIDLREVDDSESETKPVSTIKFELAPETTDGEAPDAETGAIEDESLVAEAEAEPADAESLKASTETEAADAETLETEAEAPYDETLETDSAPAASDPDWLPTLGDHQPARTWPWTVGATLLCLLLAGQLMHQFRAELLSVPAVGPALERIYSSVGVEVLAPVDLSQFNLLDLTALAETANDDQGWLIIETRVQNRGPEVQPYPHIFVRLEDRWQDTVAGRYFSPEEYAVSTISDFSRMSVGSTIDAQFIIMDPGPSATGFELELCARIVRGFKCESDLEIR